MECSPLIGRSVIDASMKETCRSEILTFWNELKKSGMKNLHPLLRNKLSLLAISSSLLIVALVLNNLLTLKELSDLYRAYVSYCLIYWKDQRRRS